MNEATAELVTDLKLWACSPRVPMKAQLVMIEAIGRLTAPPEERERIEHLQMQIGYIATELMVAGDKRSLPEIVEAAAKATASAQKGPTAAAQSIEWPFRREPMP